ncbi:MAG: helix-turn-helix domain-containing protein [Mesorhizobium sp.]|uniref:helix-turn-helix domain-containing protein n=1 Tax=Mesorhizobium sp. TaxID=1871066 RepID=UPI00120C84E3|nr:helix-turn-helix domain-containing protein [Mesorhizobium sp.]TIL93060.1 MAG: helix-turn-helix domain-containing protein [Mesorhizobium sp.]
MEGRDLQVLALFGRHTDRRGWCCRSQVKMARELSCGRSTVQRSIGRLVAAGYLEHRPIVRDSGADTAHEYRVVLDVGEGAHGRAGVPTQDGQGVPTHERAPMLTTPDKRIRESARENTDFEMALKAWPTGAHDSRKDALEAWDALSTEDRAEARSEIGRFLVTGKSVGRTHFCTFATYLRERKWKGLPERPKASPALATTPRSAAVKRPTKFQLARPELFPEVFGGASAEPEGQTR